MVDMLVHLLKLPPPAPLMARAALAGVTIRRANPWELTPVRQFIERQFTPGWADEATVGFAAKPVSVFISTRGGDVVGFAAYECTRRAFLGPMGVSPALGGQGVGAALLVAALYGLRDLGYVYGIIGGVGPVGFYEKVVAASVIPNSDPGIYTDLLKKR